MEHRIEKLEQRIQELEAKLADIAWWFTDQPALDNYVSPSVIAHAACLKERESVGQSECQEPSRASRSDAQ